MRKFLLGLILVLVVLSLTACNGLADWIDQDGCVMPTEGRTVVLLSGERAGEYGVVLQQQGVDTRRARFVLLNGGGGQIVADDCVKWAEVPPAGS